MSSRKSEDEWAKFYKNELRAIEEGKGNDDEDVTQIPAKMLQYIREHFLFPALPTVGQFGMSARIYKRWNMVPNHDHIQPGWTHEAYVFRDAHIARYGLAEANRNLWLKV
jgi:hypothetical protein